MIHQSPDVVARDFWNGTGLAEIFPRDIEQAAEMKLPLIIIPLRALNAIEVSRWLRRRDITALLPPEKRELMGCLVAHRGHGIIFVSKDDDQEEQRYTVAHEVGHFLEDYLFPRCHIIETLGESIADVLDNIRPATPAERVNAVLTHTRLAPHVHLLPRPGLDQDEDPFVACAEERADRLGLELIAPRERIILFLKDVSDADQACTEMAAYFGLPVHIFQLLVREMTQRRPISFLADVMSTLRK